MFGLSFEKLVIIGLVAAFVIGPERLPRYVEALRDAVSRFRRALDDGRARIEDDLGTPLDPRAVREELQRYDPRRIVREALADAPAAGGSSAPALGAHSAPAAAASAVPVAEATPAVAGTWTRVGGSSGHPKRIFVPAPAPAPSTADPGAE